MNDMLSAMRDFRLPTEAHLLEKCHLQSFQLFLEYGGKNRQSGNMKTQNFDISYCNRRRVYSAGHSKPYRNRVETS